MSARATALRFELERHPFFWLTQVVGARDRRLIDELRPFRLRVPEWRVLASLQAKRRCSMSELAELATLGPSTLSRTVVRLARAGWIVRRADRRDLRVTRLALTASGKRFFGRIWPAVERVNRVALQGVRASALAALRQTLQRMKRNLEGPRKGPRRAASQG